MKLNSIQFLRAVAALLVVYEHSMDVTNRFGTSWQQKFYHLDNFGCIGVDLFFVISGFIITYVANKYMGVNEGIHFMEKRFYRINPVYYIATFLCMLVFLVQQWVSKADISSTLIKIVGSLFDSLLILPASGDINSFKPLLIVGWTLSFEWLFYLLFFLLILGNVRRKTFYLPGLILLLVGIGQLLQSNDLRVQFITNPIMLEFVLGAIICQLYLSKIKIPTWIAATCLSAGLIGYGLLIRLGYGDVWYYLGAISGKTSWNKFLLWGIPSSCIVAGCVFLEKNGYLNKLFNNRGSLLLGDASYSIYLIHYIILNVFTSFYIKSKFFWQGDAMIWLQLLVATAIAIGFYKLVEKPLLQWIQNKNRAVQYKKEKKIIPIPKTAP